MVGAGVTAPRARRSAPWAAGALAAAMLAGTVGVAVNPDWQREDWRGAAAAIGPPGPARAVVVSGSRSVVPLRLYRPGLRPLAGPAVMVREVVLVASRANPPGPDPAAARALGLTIVERRREPSYELVRLRPAKPPLAISAAQLQTVRLDPGDSIALLLEPTRRTR